MVKHKLEKVFCQGKMCVQQQKVNNGKNGENKGLQNT